MAQVRVATDLVIRTFRAKPGAEAAVTHCLRSLASATVSQVAGTNVSIPRCSLGGDPERHGL